MVIAPSIPVVQNLRQSLLSPSYIDTWLQSKNIIFFNCAQLQKTNKMNNNLRIKSV